MNSSNISKSIEHTKLKYNLFKYNLFKYNLFILFTHPSFSLSMKVFRWG
jgi:hypothetical protein